MACFRLLKAYRAPGGGIVFDSKKGYADRPVELPCGQCIGCRVERSRQWALRCVHEASLHSENCFVTLTYSPSELPESGSLVVKHWQDFAKRLRRRLGSFRFFHCGEYGEENLRPHYHAAIFGQDFHRDRVLLRKGRGYSLYVSELLSDTWGKGFCTIGDLTYESAAYIARYVMKKVTGDRSEEHYTRVDPVTGECWSVVPEYVTMSRRPGIGSGWFDKFSSDVYPSDEVVHAGRKFRPPRFYDNKYSAKFGEAALLDLKAERVARAKAHEEDNTEARLKVREFVAAARLSRLARKI